MAKLINGNGNLAIYADEDADWFGSIFGGTTAITGIGNQFAYSLLDANTIGVQDGVIISKEGRRIQLNANEIDEFDIPTGAQGTTNYYIIGYRLYTDETSAQGCETFVELMDNGSDTIPEDTFRGGADEVFISLYRVKQVDLTISTVTLLLPKVSGIIQLNNDLTANNKRFSASYQNGKYGFSIDNNFYQIGGSGMPELDYGHPLHTFTSGNLSYTATKECYLVGNLGAQNVLTINGVNYSGSWASSYPFINLKLSSGDIVTLSAVANNIHVLDVKS